MNIKKVFLCFLPAILVTCIIFGLSSRNSVQSNEQSGKVTQSFISIFLSHNGNDTAQLTTNDLDTTEGFNDFFSVGWVSILNQFIRICAHISEFGGLGLMLLLGCKLLAFEHKLTIRITLIWGTIVAFSDEILQYFVPGRTCSIIDVCKDLFGICAAIYLVHLFKQLHLPKPTV